MAWRVAAAAALLGLGSGAPLAAEDGPPQHYQQTNLVSDQAGMAKFTDPHLVNPWGLAASPRGPWWASDNGTGLSTLYDGTGAIQSLVVTIPSAAGAGQASPPTGTVFNASATDFLVAPGQPAHFLFATEEGTIAGWNSGMSAVLKINRSGSAVYKGLTLAMHNGAQLLYAANFQAGTIDVFDATFAPVNLAADAFRDPHLPANYAPFNVQAVGDSLYVTFAQREAGSIDEVHGPGKGFVDVFSTSGVLQQRLQWGTWFNAPWGVALAPAGFGGFSGMVLVGQFGSGKIAAFDPASGEFRGEARTATGQTLMIDGLWALRFGNGAAAGATNVLFFTAGIDDEAHGLFGAITPLPGQPESSHAADDGATNDNAGSGDNNDGGGGGE